MSDSLLIRGARAIATCDDRRTRLQGASILTDGRRIAAVGDESAMSIPEGTRVIDASRHVVVPGLVNTHHHFYQTLTRAVPEAQNSKLFDWLITHYEIWRGVTREAVHAGAMVGLGELLLTGCTTTTDHHYLFPRQADPHLIDEEFRAAATLGIRFHPTRGSMSRGKSMGGLPPDDVCQTEDEILRDSERVIDAFHDPSPLAMTRVALAPCSPFSVTEDLMRETARLARDRGVRIHTHLSETADEDAYCLETYGKRPVALMEDLGWIGDDVWFAHCVMINDDEVRLFAATGTGVAHCPASNMRLGSGIAPIPRLLAAGAPVGLGVDGSASNDSSNMLGELRLALLLHRVTGGADAIGVDDVLWMATRGGARVLGRDDIGSIEVGKAADLALFNVDCIGHAGAVHDPIAGLLLCGDSSIADCVVCNGETVVEEGQLVRADEGGIVEKANAIARGLVEQSRDKAAREPLGRPR
ncbi:8-oxoguanine deaminase [Candidatus Sumerlaeota bacterium]|nr:8-oxoguanine deaminase [Candidatus Sumerlaeota bacterium]